MYASILSASLYEAMNDSMFYTLSFDFYTPTLSLDMVTPVKYTIYQFLVVCVLQASNDKNVQFAAIPYARFMAIRLKYGFYQRWHDWHLISKLDRV